MKIEELKIMLVSQLYPEVGGIQSWAHGYIDYCKERNISLYCVDSSLIGKRGKDSNDKANIFIELKRSINIWKQINKGLSEFAPNVVHFNTACSPKGLIRDLISVIKIKKHSNKLIIHCHCNIDDQIKNNKVGQYCFNRIVDKSNLVIVLNKKSEEYVKKITNTEVKVVPNFIDENIIVKEKKINKDIKTVLFVGHIKRTKGIREIIEASKKYKDISFRLVGPIVEKDLVVNLPNVVFVGPLSHDEVLKEMENADIFVFPSYTEGFAVSILEAMAKGLPIITTDVGTNAKLIGEGGIIIENGSENIVRAIKQLRENTIRKKMSKNNITNVKGYILDKVISRIVNTYE